MPKCVCVCVLQVSSHVHKDCLCACSNHKMLHHILNSCSVILNQGCCTWWLKPVLQHLILLWALPTYPMTHPIWSTLISLTIFLHQALPSPLIFFQLPDIPILSCFSPITKSLFLTLLSPSNLTKKHFFVHMHGTSSRLCPPVFFSLPVSFCSL